jgi:hypothetical protein
MILLFPNDSSATNDECYWELLSHVPSLEDESISVRDESFEFNKRFVSNDRFNIRAFTVLVIYRGAFRTQHAHK